MFGCRMSNICGAGIGSGGLGKSQVCKIAAVGCCTEVSGWGFESVPVPRDVPSEWTLSAPILTSPSFTQCEPDRRGGLPCICESHKT